MTELHIETEFDTYYPGSDVPVSLVWETEDHSAPPNALELRLVWNTAGKGDRDLKIVQTDRFDITDFRGRHETVLKLPWGPYSFSGKLLSLIWALELVAFPSNDSVRKEITISPNLKEVLIGSAKESTAYNMD